jgi:TRAP-type C4-dicarboxylate transport system permease large subunit
MPVDDLRLWFGVISLIVIEVGLITPPVGLNVFIINSMAKDVPMLETFRGVVPFLISDATRVGIVMLFPVISLFLPHVMR